MIAGAGGAGGVYCAITIIFPPTPNRCIWAKDKNGSSNTFVFVLNIKLGGVKLINGGSGIKPFIFSSFL